jgi:Fur family ferric uptake transcriptional regulator
MAFKTLTGTKARKKGEMPFVKKCTHAGIRMTSQRHLLATVLEEAADHPDAETIYLRCKGKDSSISIASIYRSLGIFEDYQLIQKLDVGDGKARFEISRVEHDHLMDVETGQIHEFKSQQLQIKVY